MRTFIAVVSLTPLVISAQVPPQVAKALINIGRGVCVPETAEVYRPLHGDLVYKDVAFTRDISFGPDPKDVLDVAAPEKGGGNRPVLLYISGGAGNKQQGGPNGEPFYDNVMVWAVKNGMVGVNMQRHPGANWDDPAKDVSKAVQWIGANIAKYKGNPARVFAWSQSAGNIPLSTYIGHSDLWGPKGIGLKGALLMSPPNFNIYPVQPPAGGPLQPCGKPDGSGPSGNLGPGGAGAAKGNGKGKGGPPPQPDTATLEARSNLPGLVTSKLPIMLAAAELDPQSMIDYTKLLHDELCKRGNCPELVIFKDHSHISEVMSPNTADTSVTGPILKWMSSVK
jgi:hypothetical protein